MITSSSRPKVYAHCDVPCGIYEADSMKTAAETCMKMVEKLLALEEHTGKEGKLEYQNTLVRAVLEKEEQAQICKKEILILWTDYFKPEHVAKFPDLHEKIWKATKQCSVVKRTVSVEEVKKLKEMVGEIEKIFIASKK